MTLPSGQAYNEGTGVTLDATFTVDNTPTDPTTVTFRVRQPDDSLVSYVYGTDPEVTKLDVGSYECDLGIPTMGGQYHYDAVGTGTVEATLPGEFSVIPSSVVPPTPEPGEPPQMGPCSTWIDGPDIAQLCNVDYDSTTAHRLDAAAIGASQLLFQLSGRKFAGQCQQTVRPCVQPCGTWLLGWPSQWYGFGWNGLDWGAGGWGWWGSDGSALCGCRPLSEVKLPGYPVTGIVQVKIDGDVLPAVDDDGHPNYRLDQNQLLTRMAKPGSPSQPRFWPGCQNLDLADTEQGTFSVKYTFGTPPPMPGILAAQQLGCEIFKQLSGQECKLPANTTKINRQGIEIDRLLTVWSLQTGRWGSTPRSWSTGLNLVDAFLSAYNPFGKTRRSIVWSPDTQQYARRMGAE